MSHKIKLSKKVLFIVCLVIVGVILVPVGYAYFTVTGEITASSYAYKPAFAPHVDANYTHSLSNTITNNKGLAPGAEGKFNIDIGFSSVGTNAYYKIECYESNLPTNLHLYADKEMTEEFNGIEGVYLASNTVRTAEHIIYWKWDFIDTPEANEDDLNYMDTEIYVSYSVYVAESFQEKEVVKVNDLENPTGRIALDNTSGNFNMKLDFSRFNGDTSYAVYFDKGDLGDIHLYSDSGYQNEITSLSGTFTSGSNSIINTPIYWRCEGECYTDDNDGLYYAVYILQL